MTGFNATVDPNVQTAYDEANSGGNGKFPPLPKGKYQAVIVPLAPKKQQNFEVVPFSPKDSAYAGKNVLRIRVQVDANSPTGKGRSFNVRVPLFSRYKPNEKNPQGAAARMYFDFFEKVVGATKEQVLSGQLPGWEAIAGKPLTITLSDPIMPDDWNELGSNNVDFVDAPTPGNYAATPLRQPGVPVAPWLDADDNLLQGVQAGGAVAAQQAPPAAPGGWGGAPAPQTAPAVPNGAWGTTPPPADPTLAAAAATAGPI